MGLNLRRKDNFEAVYQLFQILFVILQSQSISLNKRYLNKSDKPGLMAAEKEVCCVTAVLEGADGAVGVPEMKWFVAIVKPRHEKTVAEKLRNSGFDCYVASQPELRIWKNGRRKIVDRVVIPSVVFVRCNEAQRRSIVSLPYISRFLVNHTTETGGLNKPVAVVPDEQIAKLRFMLGQSDTPVNFKPSVFRINDNVRVIRGRLAGLEGEIIKNPDGSHVLAVGILLLGGATVFINPSDVEHI